MNRLIAVVVLVLMAGGCSFGPAPVAEQAYYAEASALTKLTAAVESTVRYKNVSPAVTDEELLKLSAAHDPMLLQAVGRYRVSVRRDNGHALLLVCKPDRDEAVFEDAGCTGALDRHHWQSMPAKSCKFTLTSADICPNL